jgi:HK97 family phage major capsid protein
MPSSVELRQQRARVVESMRAISEAAEAENREDHNLTAEERESYDRHEADFTSLTERIGRQEAQEQREAEQAQPLHSRQADRPDTPEGPEERGNAQRAAFADFIRRGVSRMAPEQRALVENSDGQVLVPEALEADILRSLPAVTVMRDLASTRTINTDRVRRRSFDEVSVGWGKLETSEQTLTDSMPDKPTDEYTYVEDLYGLAKIGEDEFDDSDVNLEAYVRDSFTRATGEAEDTGFVVGTGHSKHQPVGLFTAGGGVDTISSGAAGKVSIDDLKALIYAVPAQYRRNGSFLMASTTELAISQLKDDNGQYLWQPSVQAGRPNTFLGRALNNQEDIDAVAAGKSVAAFGDYNAAYRIYDRLGMTVQRLVELYAEDGMIGFKVRRRVTGDVVRADAVRILKVKSSS